MNHPDTHPTIPPIAATATPTTHRRCLLAAALLLAGCAGGGPAPRFYQLRLDAPAEVPPPASVPADAPVWALSTRIGLPEYLDRDSLWLASGEAGLQPLTAHRWAEPLRDSVPRLLRHDLALLRGPNSIWLAPAPAGVAVARVLRVELLALQVDASLARLKLAARWWLIDPQTLAGPVAGQADITLPAGGGPIDTLAAAHRLALWRLAERIAATTVA